MPGYDRAWLLDIRASLHENKGRWEREIRAFLRWVRPAAEAGVRRLGLRAGHPPSAADLEDILAIAEARFTCRGVEQYEGRSSPFTYYMTIVCTSAASFFRPPWHRFEVAVAVAPPEPALSEEGRRGLWRDLQAVLIQAYRLKPEWAEAVDLYLYQEAGSAEECARRLGTSAESFNQRVSRGRKLLQTLLMEGGYAFGK